MCDSDDIKELCTAWSLKDNYCKLICDHDGKVMDGYFSFDNKKNNKTHIHVFWNVDEKSYYYQLKCGGDHCGTNPMHEECDSDDYIEYYCALFKELITACDPSVGCDHGGGKRKTRKRRRQKRSRKNQSRMYSHRSK